MAWIRRVEVSCIFLFLKVIKRDDRVDELKILNRSVGGGGGTSIGSSYR